MMMKLGELAVKIERPDGHVAEFVGSMIAFDGGYKSFGNRCRNALSSGSVYSDYSTVVIGDPVMRRIVGSNSSLVDGVTEFHRGYGGCRYNATGYVLSDRSQKKFQHWCKRQQHKTGAEVSVDGGDCQVLGCLSPELMLTQDSFDHAVQEPKVLLLNDSFHVIDQKAVMSCEIAVHECVVKADSFLVSVTSSFPVKGKRDELISCKEYVHEAGVVQEMNSTSKEETKEIYVPKVAEPSSLASLIPSKASKIQQRKYVKIWKFKFKNMNLQEWYNTMHWRKMRQPYIPRVISTATDREFTGGSALRDWQERFNHENIFRNGFSMRLETRLHRFVYALLECYSTYDGE
ncbi:unnamed protein product [Eruca vesicaria subsp. sativa]|uniref:Uncharacterized protein n=1 Tax=Eruca vesicaria subsp. sativa TaxID=29727 RepID=A0ABC8IZV3_ERUVS|nr:unnamed protein product [Eruca vesicaria subsp. sativa]